MLHLSDFLNEQSKNVATKLNFVTRHSKQSHNFHPITRIHRDIQDNLLNSTQNCWPPLHIQCQWNWRFFHVPPSRNIGEKCVPMGGGKSETRVQNWRPFFSCWSPSDMKCRSRSAALARGKSHLIFFCVFFLFFNQTSIAKIPELNGVKRRVYGDGFFNSIGCAPGGEWAIEARSWV